MEAIILAGGRGERLLPMTADRPKSMVTIGHQPLLAYLLDWLTRFDISRVIISCGPLWEAIRGHFGDGRAVGMDIVYAVEREPLGRGGGMRLAMGMLSDTGAPAIVLNGDTLCNADLNVMVQRHRALGTIATALLVPYVSTSGLVEFSDDGLVTAFREKPELPYWLNGGCYVVNPALRDLLPERGDHETSTFPALARERRLGAYPARCYWRPVDTVKDLTEAEKELAHGLPALGELR